MQITSVFLSPSRFAWTTNVFHMHNHTSSSFQPRKWKQHIPPKRPKGSPFLNVAHAEKPKNRIDVRTVQWSRPQTPNGTCFLMHHIVLTLTSLKTGALDLKDELYFSLELLFETFFFAARNINQLLPRDA